MDPVEEPLLDGTEEEEAPVETETEAEEPKVLKKDEVRKQKRKEANKSYYERTRAAMRRPPSPEPVAKPKARVAKPKASVAKPVQVSKPKARVAKPREPREPPPPPPSPREQLRDLWRQVRGEQFEKKQAQYRSWLE